MRGHTAVRVCYCAADVRVPMTIALSRLYGSPKDLVGA